MQERIVKYAKKAIPYIVRYSSFIILVVIVVVTLLAIDRIDKAASVERNEGYYSTLISEVKLIKFDEATIKDIRELKSGGPTVNSNFPSNRNNPF